MIVSLANAGVPMLFFHLPAMLLALIPIVAVEMIFAIKYLEKSRTSALKGVALANCFSSLLGFPLFWLIGVLFLAFFGSSLQDNLQGSALAIFEFGASVIWLGSEAKVRDIYASGAAMIIPAFVVSVLSERWIVSFLWKDVSKSLLWRYAWYSHLLSYPLLILCWVLYTKSTLAE